MELFWFYWFAEVGNIGHIYKFYLNYNRIDGVFAYLAVVAYLWMNRKLNILGKQYVVVFPKMFVNNCFLYSLNGYTFND